MPARSRMPDAATLRRSIVIQGAADQVARLDLHCEPPHGPLADRLDVLVFETEPLDQPIEVTGPVNVSLFVSCDAPDTDLFAMLLDIYPHTATWPTGYRMNVCDGIMRLRYREGMDKPKLLTPGDIVEVSFPLYPTSNVFDVGHRIQLMLSGASFPRFDVNPNTGEAIGKNTGKRKATITIHHSVDHPSTMVLPVVPT